MPVRNHEEQIWERRLEDGVPKIAFETRTRSVLVPKGRGM
jgi:hypothetical protein